MERRDIYIDEEPQKTMVKQMVPSKQLAKSILN